MKQKLINKKIFEIRRDIIKLSFKSSSAHLGSSLSVVEIIFACLYFKIKNKMATEIIFSKGHAAMAYYASLYQLKLMKKKLLDNYLKDNSSLWAHLSKRDNQYFKFSFGSLGYGLGISAGVSIGYKSKNKSHKVLCILSDGELNEGSIWESLMFISHHNLKNITILIDSNKIQSFGRTDDVIKITNLKKIFENLKYNVHDIDGHNFNFIYKIIKKSSTRPKIIICNTIKGKGISEIEDTISSHYKPATLEQLKIYEK
jgi:transketolase